MLWPHKRRKFVSQYHKGFSPRDQTVHAKEIVEWIDIQPDHGDLIGALDLYPQSLI
jgi:hypothetical protein